MNIELITIDQLESQLSGAFKSLHSASEALASAWKELGRILYTMRGVEGYRPYLSNGYASWTEYVNKRLEPEYGLTLSRAGQVLAAYEIETSIYDALNDKERAQEIRRRAAEYAANVPSVLPSGEAPYRALAGVEGDDRAVVLAIAATASEDGNPSYYDVIEAKKVHAESKRTGEKFTAQEVRTKSRVLKIIQELEGLSAKELEQIAERVNQLIVKQYGYATVELQNA